MSDPRRWVSALLALACGTAGGFLALAHPISPTLALAGFYVVAMVAVWLPGIWLFAVSACLPFLNFAPWTGWLIFDEFDLLLLAVLAAGYLRLARLPRDTAFRWTQRLSFSTAIVALFAAASLVSLARGILDTDGFTWGWFQGYGDAMNSLRATKSLLWATLCIPLLADALRQSVVQSCKRLAAGMLVGLVVVTLVVLWERAAFPGWFNFTSKYRTTALFWEMHVGGAAIDAYLALATPFVAWALRSARRPWQWAWGALLAVLVTYAGLTTFSRGVYLSMVAPLLLLGLLLWVQKAGLDLRAMVVGLWQRRRPRGWRAKAAWALGIALMAEVVGVLNGGSFMASRLTTTERDFGSRMAHWQRGLDLLQEPVDWLAGIGLGRLPSHYARSYPEGEWPGHVAWQAGQGAEPPVMRVSGPDTDDELEGLFAATQRVNPVPGARYRASLQVRVAEPVGVYLQLCERHLLYPARCQDAYLEVKPTADPAAHPWQRIEVPLRGPNFQGGPWFAPRLGMLSVMVLGAGTHADFRSIGLQSTDRKELLVNGDFAQNLAHWFPAARFYFLPWHIDNLLFEVLIERGLPGLLLWAALVGTALWQLVLGSARRQPLAPYLAASLSGVLLVGLVSSVMDVPRVAFLLFLLAYFALQLARASPSPELPKTGLLHI
ncbi:hypothetical protein [Rhodoferax sp.]|uniref:hypothetical protein n=1 Tax=Rhodoferax sp. TaxID=50421 RepID=UPI0025D6F49E|nr:hypothetical protein [Rhodoferax sp.]